MSYSLDGVNFMPLGERMIMVFQLKTFQGIRYALFACNADGCEGGHADFDGIVIDEPHPRGLMSPIPAGSTGRLTLASDPSIGLDAKLGTVRGGTPLELTVEAVGLGRVVLRHRDGALSVTAGGMVSIGGLAGQATHFQWMETPTGEVTLMSLLTHRFLRIHPDGLVSADSTGPTPDGRDGTRFKFVAG